MAPIRPRISPPVFDSTRRTPVAPLIELFDDTSLPPLAFSYGNTAKRGVRKTSYRSVKALSWERR